MKHGCRRFAFAILISQAVCTLATAQTGSLRGIVYRDSAKTPLPGADVVVSGVAYATTNEAGKFELKPLPAGLMRVQIRRVGFAMFDDTISVAAGEATVRNFTLLPPAQALDSIRVRANGNAGLSIAMRAFEDRRRAGSGHFITSDELRTLDYRPLYDILRGIPGAEIVSYKGSRFLSASSGGAKPTSPLQHALVRDANSPLKCWPQVIVDGVRVFAPGQEIDVPDIGDWRAFQLEAVEFYDGPSTTPTQFSAFGAPCGTLLLWTRQRLH